MNNMRIGIFQLLIFLIIFSSCESQTDNKMTANDFFLQYYYKGKESFNDSLTNHFPKELGNKVLSYSSSCRNEPEEIKYLTLLMKLTEKEKQEYKNKIAVLDSCTFEIFVNKNYYGFDYDDYINCEDIIPVPEMKLITYNDSIVSDIKYYVIETSKDKIFHHDLYLRYYLPDEWTNGMTRGVGINVEENVISYWLMIW